MKEKKCFQKPFLKMCCNLPIPRSLKRRISEIEYSETFDLARRLVAGEVTDTLVRGGVQAGAGRAAPARGPRAPRGRRPRLLLHRVVPLKTGEDVPGAVARHSEFPSRRK